MTMQLRSCFGFDTFFATDVRRFGDGGIFIGNLRKPVKEAISKLEKKLSEAAGRDVVVWFMEERTDEITKQVCMVQPKAEIDLQFELTNLSNPWGYICAILLFVTTCGTIALMSGFFTKPDATFDEYLANVAPLFGGFVSILGVSEICCCKFLYHGGYRGTRSLGDERWRGTQWHLLFITLCLAFRFKSSL